MSTEPISNGSGFSERDLQFYTLMQQGRAAGIRFYGNGEKEALDANGKPIAIDTVEISDEARALSAGAVGAFHRETVYNAMNQAVTQGPDRFAADFIARMKVQEALPDWMREGATKPTVDERGYNMMQGMIPGWVNADGTFVEFDEMRVIDDMFPSMCFGDIEEREATFDYVMNKLDEAGIDFDVVGKMNLHVRATHTMAHELGEYKVTVNSLPSIGGPYALNKEEAAAVEEVFKDDNHLKQVLLQAQSRFSANFTVTIDLPGSASVRAEALARGEAMYAVMETQKERMRATWVEIDEMYAAIDAREGKTQTNEPPPVQSKAEATTSISTEQTSAAPSAETKETPSLWTSPASIAEYLGFGGVDSRKELVALLESRIGKSRDDLQTRIGNLLRENDITLGEDERLTFSIDDDGAIEVGGIDDKKTLARIEEILNADGDLGKRMRTLATEQSALLAIRKGRTPDASIRRALVEDLLAEKGLTLKEAGISADGKAALANLGLTDAQIAEVEAVKKEDGASLKAMLEFQNETLVHPDTIKDAHASLSDLFDSVMIEHPKAFRLVEALTLYNEMADEYGGERIHGFNFRIADGGRLSVDREGLNDGDASMIASWFGVDFKEAARAVTEELLIEHQAEHGDVDEFKHEVVFHVDAQSGIRAEVRSEEADRAARAEIDEASKKLSGIINDSLSDSPLAAPVRIAMDESGRLRMTGDDTAPEVMQVEQIIDMLNLALENEEASVLPDELRSAFEHARTIRDALGKIHDPGQRTATIRLG